MSGLHVVTAKPMANGYIRFSVEIGGLIIVGFRTTKIYNIVLPPEASYHGHPYRIVQMNAAAETELLRQVKAYMETPDPAPAEDIYCAKCGVKHAADYHSVAV